MSTDTAPPAGAAPEAVIARTDPRWRRLHAIVDAHSLLRGDFVLTSGRPSHYLFQLRQTTLHPEGAWLVGEILVEFLQKRGMRGVGGLELGAVPIVAAAACLSHHRNYPVDAFFIRKTAKSHGARERVNGYVGAGQEVVIADDVTTTGGSIVDAARGLAESHDCTVNWAFSIVDREEGAREALADAGITLVSILSRGDFDV